MCNDQYSESGALCSIDGCAEYRRLLDHNTTLQDEVDALRQQIAQYIYAVQHVTEDGPTTRSFVAGEGWAMVHKDRLAQLEIAEESRDALLPVLEKADALVFAMGNKCKDCKEHMVVVQEFPISEQPDGQ